jgi:hypothetical protein
MTFTGISLPAVSLGLLLAWRRPDSPVGSALILLAAAPVLTDGIEGWGTTFGTAYAWPGAHVIDDGLGGARSGFGLTALRDRVTALGGRIEVISPVGRGTTIRAEL